MKTLFFTLLIIFSCSTFTHAADNITVDGANIIDKLEDIVEPLTDNDEMNCEARFYIGRNVIVMGSIWIKSELTKDEADDDDFNLKVGLKCKNGKEQLKATAVIMAKKNDVKVKRLKIIARNLSLN